MPGRQGAPEGKDGGGARRVYIAGGVFRVRLVTEPFDVDLKLGLVEVLMGVWAC